MLRYFTFLLFCILISNTIIGQTHNCGTAQETNTSEVLAADRLIRKQLDANQYKQKKNTLDTLIVPVVFHVVHFDYDSVPGMGTNVTDSALESSIDRLNNAFRNRGQFQISDGVDAVIEFRLAKQDECGALTTGVNRVEGIASLNMFGGDGVEMSIAENWDPTRYFNIYTWQFIYNGPIPNIAGYSSLPHSHGFQTDGVHINYVSLLDSNQTTFMHEVGHYLGLLHTFEGGCKNDDCTLDGDKVCDTPPDNNTGNWSYNCDTTINSCFSDTMDQSINNPFRPIRLGGLGDQNDLGHNYMDYTNYVCQTTFTQGQADRMRASLIGIRASLLQPGVLDPPCPILICSDFTQNSTENSSGELRIYEQYSLTLENTTTSGSNYKWYINDNLYSTSEDTTWKPDTTGVFYIKLCVSDSLNSCTKCKQKRTAVICSLTAQLGMESDTVSLNKGVRFFHNTAQGADALLNTTFSWYIDGNFISNDTTLFYTFNTVGKHYVTYQIDNGVCASTRTDSIFVECDRNLEFFAKGDTYILPGTELTFGIPQNKYVSHQWYLDDTPMGDSDSINHTFSNSGSYWVKLVASNGICTDSGFQLIQVQGCEYHEADNWCFSTQNHLKFEGEEFIQLDALPVWSYNSASSISDVEGNLLLYSDGRVYDNNYNFLGGSQASISYRNGNIFLRKPGSANQYLNLLLESGRRGVNSIIYRDIDITANRMSGSISEKKTLISSKGAQDFVAINHANNTDKWVIYPNIELDSIQCILLTKTGFNTPINSPIPSALVNTLASGLTFCPNTNRLATVLNHRCYLYHFDRTSGLLSDSVSFALPNNISSMAFSPSGQILYAINNSDLFQFNLESNSPQIANTIVTLDSNQAFRKLQIAPNGFIYIANSTYIADAPLPRITRPDSVGTGCNYQYDNSSTAYYHGTLPNFNSSYFEKTDHQVDLISPMDTIDLTDEITIKYDTKAFPSHYKFTVTQGSITNQNDSSITVTFNSIGTHSVVAESILCSDSILGQVDIVVIDKTANTKQLEDGNFTVFPVPTSSTINIINKDNQPFSLELIDLNGKLLQKKDRVIDSSINLFDYPTGLYYLKLTSNGSIKTFKIVKI